MTSVASCCPCYPKKSGRDAKLCLSARAHDKVLRIARTIADLDAKDHIAADHLAEAIQYRRLDRRL
jgi:predicted ATPase with chaperone activity